MDLVKLSRDLMWECTQKNKAPSWNHTEIAVAKGRELAKKYEVDEELVVSSLYLAHTVFSRVWKGDVQKSHNMASAEFVKPYLIGWNVPEDNQKIILNSIESHDNKVATESKIAEIVKNAECFKFVTVDGALKLLHEFGVRNIPFGEAVDKVLHKMDQKIEFLTLDDCISEAEENCKKIKIIFKDWLKE